MKQLTLLQLGRQKLSQVMQSEFVVKINRKTDEATERLFRWLFLTPHGKAPFSTRVLREAGYWSYRKMLEKVFLGFMVYCVLLGCITGFLIYGPPWETSVFWANLLILILVCMLFVFVARKQFINIRDFQIGYYAERRVSEMLERLGRSDWYIFHNLDVKEFGSEMGGDIDHVVVCLRGVFCVETKALRKFPNQNKAKLIYSPGNPNGILRYPSGRDLKDNPLWELRKRTIRFHNHLKQNCGGHGNIFRILVLPECEIEMKGSDEWEFVCSQPEEVEKFINASKVKLESKQIKKIADFLDKKLRRPLEETH